MNTQSKLAYLKNLTVLYADDDIVLVEYMKQVLDGFFDTVMIAKNGVEALELYANNTIHIVILDDKMPLMSGLEVASSIRKQNSFVPIFFATNYKDADDLLVAVKLNLVDYIIKPLSFDRLQEALFACIDKMESSGLLHKKIIDNIYYDNFSKCIIKNEKTIVLTKMESAFLEYLIAKNRAVATIEELEYHVWNGQMSKDALRNHIKRLRQKLGVDIIENIHNIGYRLV